MLHSQSFITSNFQDHFSISILDPLSIQTFVSNLQASSSLYFSYILLRMGYPDNLYSYLTLNNQAITVLFERYQILTSLCAMQYYDVSAYDLCVADGTTTTITAASASLYFLQ